MIDPYKIREDFPMYRNHITMQGKPLVWLDNASTTFKPDCVLSAVEEYYTHETSNSHRGDYDLCFNVDEKILDTRKLIGQVPQLQADRSGFHLRHDQLDQPRRFWLWRQISHEG
jgi:selenocysteine lyase/cysteine desulfurase